MTHRNHFDKHNFANIKMFFQQWWSICVTQQKNVARQSDFHKTFLGFVTCLLHIEAYNDDNARLPKRLNEFCIYENCVSGKEQKDWSHHM